MNAKLTLQSKTIMQRIADADKSAVVECLNAYGNFVWRTVRKVSSSDKDAEAIVENVFADICKYAKRFSSANLSENDFILMLIRNRLRQKQIH